MPIFAITPPRRFADYAAAIAFELFRYIAFRCFIAATVSLFALSFSRRIIFFRAIYFFDCYAAIFTFLQARCHLDDYFTLLITLRLSPFAAIFRDFDGCRLHAD
jgi:hypothetical protein